MTRETVKGSDDMQHKIIRGLEEALAYVRGEPLHCPECGATDGGGCGACPEPAVPAEPDAYTRAAVAYAEASIALNDAERKLTEAVDRKEPDTDDLRSDVCSAGYEHDDAEEAFEALYRERHDAQR